MAHIEFEGISPTEYKLINSKKFRKLLEQHPNLRLVSVSEDEDSDEEIFTDVLLPLDAEHDDYVALMDTSCDDQFMWVLFDDFVSVQDPSDSLIQVLLLMDKYSIKKHGNRLFLDQDSELYNDDPALLEAVFDFGTGHYVS